MAFTRQARAPAPATWMPTRHATVRLLSQMAYAGGGGFSKFDQADQIPAGLLKMGQDIYSSADALVFKELVVSNINAVPDPEGVQADTDADGLPDQTERKIGTCPRRGLRRQTA